MSLYDKTALAKKDRERAELERLTSDWLNAGNVVSRDRGSKVRVTCHCCSLNRWIDAAQVARHKPSCIRCGSSVTVSW
jgi:hypothetical protein